MQETIIIVPFTAMETVRDKIRLLCTSHNSMTQ